MKLGTIAYNNEIYNLDYMTSVEIDDIIKKSKRNTLELWKEKYEKAKNEIKLMAIFSIVYAEKITRRNNSY